MSSREISPAFPFCLEQAPLSRDEKRQMTLTSFLPQAVFERPLLASHTSTASPLRIGLHLDLSKDGCLGSGNKRGHWDIYV